MSNDDNDYDSPWKEALKAYFPQFMQLLFPKAHAEIDWSMGHEFMDTELQKIVRDAGSGRRHTDKLVKVHTLDRKEIWVLIHVEIQGRAGRGFNERMYRYHYRLTDHYPKRKIASFAVLTNQKNTDSLGSYEQSIWETTQKFTFPIINLQDWSERMDELESNPNPFAIVILAQLVAHNVSDSQQKFNGKFRLIKLLYQRGYSRQQVLDLFRFIDWMIQLPKELELQLSENVARIEEENKMPYVTNIERFAIEKGEALGEVRGEIKGESSTLLKLIKLKFGEISAAVEQKVTTADKAQLDIWVDRILTAETLESLFGNNEG